jgi:Uma2 family endonuclease
MKRPARKPMTLDEIDALEDATGQRYELWHGEPVAMTGGTLRHNLIALGLSRAIYSAAPARLPGGGGRCQAASRRGHGQQCHLPRRDGGVRSLPGSYQTRPVLLAEVLSDSSTRRDRVDKPAAYTALESLAAYLILSQQEVLVECLRARGGLAAGALPGTEGRDEDRGARPLPAAPRVVCRCAGGSGRLNRGGTRP